MFNFFKKKKTINGNLETALKSKIDNLAMALPVVPAPPDNKPYEYKIVDSIGPSQFPDTPPEQEDDWVWIKAEEIPAIDSDVPLIGDMRHIRHIFRREKKS